ncbi:MAG: rhomboid family intramembrane serine protease [Spirochaetaceae bacterium]|nr:rhomboid family intramembrane serine protease [Spirochaetaceae bacterium]
MKIRYNAPVVLSYAVAAAVVMVIDQIAGAQFAERNFAIPGSLAGSAPLGYLRLITHVLGHANWAHLLANFALILLIGPILEEKYGSWPLLLMMAITALATGGLNVLFLSTGLMGASGIVFMMILLSSFTNIRSGEIPLTFVLVVLMYLTREVFAAVTEDSISQFAHIAGGICGSLFGFAITRAAPQLVQPAEPTDHLEE